MVTHLVTNTDLEAGPVLPDAAPDHVGPAGVVEARQVAVDTVPLHVVPVRLEDVHPVDLEDSRHLQLLRAELLVGERLLQERSEVGPGVVQGEELVFFDLGVRSLSF